KISRGINKDPEGLILGKDGKTGEVIARPWKSKSYLNSFPNNNVALVGSSGFGKTSSFLLPAVFEFMRMGYSVICTDPKGELYRETYPVAIAA
uniref:type IV secretory system conjugative DNA transfer family protein n=1 Tax=Salmonella enterica TaxID=28901 RepID=UPI0020C3E3E0